MKRKVKLYSELIRLNKPIGILLLLWPTITALCINLKNFPSLKNIIVFFCGVFITRSLGCAVNDIADRNFDKYIERTKNRPITDGSISIYEALSLVFIMVVISFFTVLQLDLNSILFSPFILTVIFVYPFFKRFFSIPQFILGIAFALSVLLIYISERRILDEASTCLFFATILWAIIYDTQYAMVDKFDDIKIKIKSSAILFGNYDKIVIFIMQLFHISIYIYIYIILNINVYLFFLLLLGLGFIFYQQYLIKERIIKNCFRAFLNNNYYGLIINLPILIHYSL